MCSAIARMAAAVRRPRMAGDALSLVENLDRLVGDADVDEFADQPERRGIPVAVDFDMVVGGDAAALPDGEGVGLVGQRLQRRLVDGRKEFDTARVVTLHDADVDVADVFEIMTLRSAALKNRRLRSLAR